MRKTVIRTIYLVVVFIVSCLLISKVMSQGNTDITMEMAEPTYPIVSFRIGNESVNQLHGYAKPMDCGYLRDTILPISSDRTAYYRIECYGSDVDSMLFEVRSMDGERLVESTGIPEFYKVGDCIDGSIVLKDLIDPDREYMLVFILHLKDGQEVRYYTRILQTESCNIEEKLAYVRQFHNRTFRKEKVAELSKYMEPNSEGDNTTLSKVTIHSNLKQLGYVDLEMTKLSDPVIDIKEVAKDTGSFELNYVISGDYNKQRKYYFVNEKYRIRYTPDRIYLLDYQRTMDQIFDENDDIFANDKIDLGITDENVSLVESDGGNVFAFQTAGKLFSYNIADHKLAKLFSFPTDQINDKRSNYGNHDIKILNVDETGNVEFMVYGYMNRGRHEGHVGLVIYTYNSLLNTVEENCYLDYAKSAEILKEEVEQLAFVSKEGTAYFVLDGTVYAFRLKEHTYDIVASNLVRGNYQVSTSNQMLVYQSGGELYSCRSMTLCNLQNGTTTQVEAGHGNYILPLGFMGEDLVYGLAKMTDVVTDRKGNTIFPMYCLKIQNAKGELLKTYQMDDIYIMGWEFGENQIQLELAKKNEEGLYVETTGDQIVNTEEVKAGSNVISTAITEEYEKIVQIQMKQEVKAKNVKILSPKEVIFEGQRSFVMQKTENEKERYYVYDLYGIRGIYQNPGTAVSVANQYAGVVVGNRGEYIWIRGNLVTRNQIMAIKDPEQTEPENSLSNCLDMILRYNGVSTNTEVLLQNGSNVLDILRNNLPNATVLELSGCNLESVLYYLNRDIPVLVLLNDGTAVALTGFNETQVVIYNPVKDALYKISKNEAATWFEENGNNFITYIPTAD